MSLSGTITSWVVIFVLPINSALNPILYTLTTSFFREQVELLWCRWHRQPRLRQDRKSLTNSVIHTDPSRSSFYHHSYNPQTSILDKDGRYRWRCSILWKLHLSVVDLQSFWSDRAQWQYLGKASSLMNNRGLWSDAIMKAVIRYLKILWLDNNKKSIKIKHKVQGILTLCSHITS